MANLHLELSSPNFGIHEWCRFPDHVYDLFPGMPRAGDGYLYPNEAPGLGIDFNEALANKAWCDNGGRGGRVSQTELDVAIATPNLQ